MKIKISEAHSITVMMDFIKNGVLLSGIQKEDDTIHFEEPAQPVKEWTRVEGAVSFHPGLLEDVITESMKLAGDPVGWRGNEVFPFILKTQNKNIWEDVSQWK